MMLLHYHIGGFDGTEDCDGALDGLCRTDDDGWCAVDQAAVDTLHEEECLDWSPGSDCVVLGSTCTPRFGGADSSLGCCISAIEDSGEELCITDDNGFDGHVDCLNEVDENPVRDRTQAEHFLC